MNRQLRIILFTLILAVAIFSQTERLFVVVPADSLEDNRQYPSESVGAGDLERYPSAGLPEILNSETFVQFGNLADDGYSSPFVNGIPSYFSSVYFDGLRLYSPQLGQFELKWFAEDMLKSVEVLTGGNSHLSGLGMIGGAIDIGLRDLPEKQDYTKISGGWGNSGYKEYSGMFLKRFKQNAGIGVSASELNADGLFEDDRDARLRNYSAVSWFKFEGFDLRLFGSRFEGRNRSMNLTFSDSVDVNRQEDDHRFFDGEIVYSTAFGDFSLRFDHQEYERKLFFEDESGFEKIEDNIDAALASFSTSVAKNTDLLLNADYTVSTMDNTSKGKNRDEQIGGGVTVKSRFGDVSGQAGLRAVKIEDSDIYFIPGISIRSEVGESYSIFAGGGAGYHPSILGNDVSEQPYYFGEAGLEYNHDKLDVYLKGYHSRFREQNFFVSEGFLGDFVQDTLGKVYGIQGRIEYAPDELFLLGARYIWNSPEYSIRGLPEHFVQTYIEEKKLYGHDEISLTLRLEADGYFNLPGEAPNAGILRCRGKLKYIGVSIFGQFSYAFVEDDGWHNGEFYLRELIPGKSWRIGALWELFD
jgi:outer membrane receptor protein involved in Fe transport